jgi:DnaJ-domain-containing protein 1
LLFTRPLLQFGTATYRPSYCPTDRPTGGTITVSLVAGPVQPLPAPRPPRQLTVRQQRALDALVALGAELDANFTARELRSAYRALARQYHPDRHPFSSHIEKARLARVFAALNQNHRCLLAELIEPGIPTRH